MQIITIDNLDFPILQESLTKAQKIGHYVRDGRMHVVFANTQFVFVTAIGIADKIAIKPTHGITQATEFAKQIINREAARGAEIKISEQEH